MASLLGYSKAIHHVQNQSQELSLKAYFQFSIVSHQDTIHIANQTEIWAFSPEISLSLILIFNLQWSSIDVSAFFPA